MTKNLPDDWVVMKIPPDVKESVWAKWLLFNNVTYVIINSSNVAIKDIDVALLFRLTFGI